MQRFMRTCRNDRDAKFIGQELYCVQGCPLIAQLTRQKMLDFML